MPKKITIEIVEVMNGREWVATSPEIVMFKGRGSTVFEAIERGKAAMVSECVQQYLVHRAGNTTSQKQLEAELSPEST